MGIERLFSTLENNPIANTMKPFLKQIIKGTKVPATYFLIDFNSILHMVSAELVADLNTLLLKIILGVIGDEVSKNLIEKFKFNFITKSTTYNEYVSYLTRDKVNDLIIDKMEDYIKNIILNVITTDKLKVIYIAMDGTPSKAKMMEQRNRRWVSYITEELKKKIYDKYEKELMSQKVRYLYEGNKIQWSNRAITVGTPFMDKVEKRLTSQAWIQFIRKSCISLKKYIYTGYNIPGEGEKKVINFIRNEKITIDDYIMIYSPDSDVILLAMLLETSIGGHKALKHISLITNQKKRMSNILEVDTFIDNLHDYVHKKSKFDFEQNKLIRDLVFLFTIFGNDFVPKIESFDVNQNFSMLIDNYIDVFDGEYIIQDKKQRAEINHDMFLKVLEHFSQHEEKLIYAKYLNTICVNFRTLLKKFDATNETLLETVEKYLEFITKLIGNVEKGKEIDDDVDFSKYYDLLVSYVQLDESDYPLLHQEDFKQKLTKYIQNHKKINITKLKFMPYSTSTDNEMHKRNIEKSVKDLNVDFKVLDYDKEIYALQNMLDEYSTKFNNKKYIIGKVQVDYNNYTLKKHPYKKMREYYYEKVVHSTDEEDIEKLVKAYVEGYMWVFEYYYNTYNHENGDIWYYKYTKTPLLKDFYSFYKNNIKLIKNIQSKVIKSQQTPKYYFLPLEQLFYISVNLNDFGFNDDILNLQRDLAANKIYPDVSEMVENIWNNEKNKYLDCRGQIFASKCHIKKNRLKISDQELIKFVRTKFPEKKNHNIFKITF